MTEIRPEKADEVPFGDLIGRVIGNARNLALAEIEVLRQRAECVVIGLRGAVILIGVGIVGALAAAVVILAAVAIGLTPLLGAFWATLATGIAAAVLAFLVIQAGIRKISRQWEDSLAECGEEFPAATVEDVTEGGL